MSIKQRISKLEAIAQAKGKTYCPRCDWHPRIILLPRPDGISEPACICGRNLPFKARRVVRIFPSPPDLYGHGR